MQEAVSARLDAEDVLDASAIMDLVEKVRAQARGLRPERFPVMESSSGGRRDVGMPRNPSHWDAG